MEGYSADCDLVRAVPQNEPPSHAVEVPLFLYLSIDSRPILWDSSCSIR